MNKFLKALRLFCLTPGEYLYLRRIRRSGLFDRDFYRRSNPLLHGLYRRMPERHFVLLGERAGLFPNPLFSPHSYLQQNLDLVRQGIRPFDHYIGTGQNELRRALAREALDAGNDGLPPPLGARPAAKAPQAIVAHLFYHDLWPEFRDQLRAVDFPFDLYVSLTERGGDAGAQATRALARTIAADFPGANVVCLPNLGRDIFPFVHFVNAGWLEGYAAVGKIHTKRSPHRTDGDDWRRALIRGILPAEGAARLLALFKADKRAAFWVADGYHYTDKRWWGANSNLVKRLLHRLEIDVDMSRLSFPAGSIYWMKPEMVDMIRGLALSPFEFEPELGQTDGTLAHAMERALGALAENSGGEVRQTGQLKDLAAPALPQPARVTALYFPPGLAGAPGNGTLTEHDGWAQVSAARPWFSGHAQPLRPVDLALFGRTGAEVMARQAAMARSGGIDTFALRLGAADLAPGGAASALLSHPDIDIGFYPVLDPDLAFLSDGPQRNSLALLLADPRQSRDATGRARVVLDLGKTEPDEPGVARARAVLTDLAKGGGLELGLMLAHPPSGPVAALAARAADFCILPTAAKPETWIFGQDIESRMQPAVAPEFVGTILDYRAQRLVTPIDSVPILPALIVGQDNTAVAGAQARITWGGNPASFARAVEDHLTRHLGTAHGQELFLLSFNDWLQGAVLEPSCRWQGAYLAALARGIDPRTGNAGS